MLEFLHAWTHPQENILRKVLQSNTVIFVPIINVDSVVENIRQFELTGKPATIRKNRHSYSDDCIDSGKGTGPGVDLNRNYGYAFGLDDEGSSSNPCSADYRGPSAFSEPETRSVRDFITQWPNIHFALNFHAFGNFLLTPINADPKENSNLSQFREASAFYNILHKAALLPSGNVMGNGRTTINYTANGEASDWMLAKRNVISMSPELGTGDHRTDHFYLEPKMIVKVVSENAIWIHEVYKALNDGIY